MHTITLPLKSINLTKVGLAATALVLLTYFAVDYGFVAMAQSSGTELFATSIDGGGGTMSGGSLSLEYSIAQSQPVGSGSSASYSLESGFIPVIAQDYSQTTPPSVSAPAISGPVAGLLLVGMLVIVLVSLVRNRSRSQA